ncbi:MAG TPA: nucleoside deaminase [Candidatus Mucispirillum faecigallinarum]|uniref:tRNA-specific adenosine deaminase n=1 Tax=Candidatus Mucispirillum faecigallinarum TaxID=2838699 RepID=A0A9D2GUN6_9BACT|nr:nucleoside deaminase [Candidatus Mucispirillum faecigallinarum]
MDNHLKYMQLAYYQAQKAFDIMEVPVGAVIVKDDKVIGAGYNKKETNKSPISHAEIEAIQAACKNTNDWRLNGASLYVTAEPCIMCAGAILHARIDKVYFGVKEPKFGGVVSIANIFDINKMNHRVEYFSGLMSDEINQLMKSFFIKLRNYKN